MLKSVNIKIFPDLIFDLSTDYEKFHLVMNYEDLFEEKGDYIYFKVIVTSNEISTITINENWIFGKEFFRNKIIAFNKERRDINIYYKEKTKKNNNNNNIDNNLNDEKENNVFKVLWVLVMVLALMAGVIAYLLVKCIKQGKIIKKRSRLNILEDEYTDGNIN